MGSQCASTTAEWLLCRAPTFKNWPALAPNCCSRSRYWARGQPFTFPTPARDSLSHRWSGSNTVRRAGWRGSPAARCTTFQQSEARSRSGEWPRGSIASEEIGPGDGYQSRPAKVGGLLLLFAQRTAQQAEALHFSRDERFHVGTEHRIGGRPLDQKGHARAALRAQHGEGCSTGVQGGAHLEIQSLAGADGSARSEEHTSELQSLR